MTDWPSIQTALDTLHAYYGHWNKVAEAVGVTPFTINNWKNQTNPPQRPSIEKLIKALSKVPESSTSLAFGNKITYDSLKEQKAAEGAKRLEQLVDAGIVISIKSLEAERDRLQSALEMLERSLSFLRIQLKRIQEARAHAPLARGEVRRRRPITKGFAQNGINLSNN